MRCIALLSGGKDSVAAIEVAQGSGWEVVAALRMVPDEDDSFMFHTPNLDVVAGVAEAMGIPLISAPAPADSEREIQAMEDALRSAKDEFQLDSIISGALASDYQKVRVDGVGHRLGLRTFAPLWHKQREPYVRSLISAGYNIKLSRVAADGLTEEMAGATLDAKLVDRIKAMPTQPDIAGEGGEYESLVLDAPHYSSRIVIDKSRVEATASRATWHVEEFHLETKA